jgi:hypothetical protein
VRVELVEIPDVDTDWELVHKVRALRLGQSAPALEALLDLRTRHAADHAKLLETVRIVAGVRRVTEARRVRKDVRGEDVYEMKGGHSRLFFFYTPNDEIVVCTNHYWKAKPSRREQDAAFRRCARMRELYLRTD